ncbi:MAG: energy-coupled thiamine transporter ThiT [Clostridia bacterium]|nr:energy-coupled thiamine transporter ThiT [Clostridia bacterium]
MSFKFSSLSATVWAILVTCIIAGVVVFLISKDQKKWTIRMIANAALCIALAFLLSCIRLYKLPQGGSITLASMLPLFLFAYVYGVGPGMLVGAAYGFLQFIQDAYFVHPVELILDYPLAFAMLGLCGLAKKFPDSWGIIPGIAIGTLGRFLCAFISGIIFFGMYAPEGQNVLVYSAVYNGFYLIPEAAICIVIGLIPQIRTLANQLALSDKQYR